MADDPRFVSYDPKYQVVKVDDRPSAEDADLARHQRRLTFYLVVALLVLATLGSAYLAFIVPATDLNHADKEWARTTLASIVAGVVGYAFGRK